MAKMFEEEFSDQLTEQFEGLLQKFRSRVEHEYTILKDAGYTQPEPPENTTQQDRDVSIQYICLNPHCRHSWVVLAPYCPRCGYGEISKVDMSHPGEPKSPKEESDHGYYEHKVQV